MTFPLNVAYIDHTGELGGAECLLLNLLTQLPRNKVIPFLFCGSDGSLSFEARKLGIHTEIVRLPKFYSTSWVWRNQKVLNPFALLWNCISLFLAGWYLRRKIQTLQIDIIQSNTIPSHIYGGITARFLKIPCVWYFHDLVESHRLAGIMVVIWRILARILANRIVGDSQAVINHFASNSLAKVIYPGVLDAGGKDYKTIPSLYERLNLPVNSILVGSLGRIAYVKGLDVLIDSAQIVVKQNQDIHFVIFGGSLFGEENYKTVLEKKVKHHDLTKNWHWMGYDEFAKEHLKELNFIVFPSRREAFGLAVVEAGLSGKAVIATSVGGIPEIIDDGNTGIIVPPENAQELALAISKLASDPQLAITLGGNAKTRVKRLFNNSRFIDDFLDFYETLII